MSTQVMEHITDLTEQRDNKTTWTSYESTSRRAGSLRCRPTSRGAEMRPPHRRQDGMISGFRGAPSPRRYATLSGAELRIRSWRSSTALCPAGTC